MRGVHLVTETLAFYREMGSCMARGLHLIRETLVLYTVQHSTALPSTAQQAEANGQSWLIWFQNEWPKSFILVSNQPTLAS